MGSKNSYFFTGIDPNYGESNESSNRMLGWPKFSRCRKVKMYLQLLTRYQNFFFGRKSCTSNPDFFGFDPSDLQDHIFSKDLIQSLLSEARNCKSVFTFQPLFFVIQISTTPSIEVLDLDFLPYPSKSQF